jgi:hypothetical protein
MPSSASKKTPKRARTILTSDDDDYSGVDLISDTEEDEPDVEVAEEQAIIESEEDEDSHASPQPEQEDDDASDWGGFELEDDPGLFFDEQMARTNAPDMYSSATGWIAGQNSGDESPTETARRVRFDLSDSDTAVSDIEDNIFPDIFLDQNSLDPGFRRSIENDRDNDNDDPPSEDGSYWDFRGDEQETPANTDMDEGNQSESSYGSSGYESGCCNNVLSGNANQLQLMKVKLLKRIFQLLPNTSQPGPFFDASPPILHPPKKISLSSDAILIASQFELDHALVHGLLMLASPSQSWTVAARS